MVERDHLRVDVRPGRADRLYAELVVLAQSARLGPFIAEDGGEVAQLLHHALGAEVVLDEGADDGRSALGTEGQAAAAAVLEGVHLLVDQLGPLADAAREQLGLFEEGGANLAVAVTAADLAEGGFEPPPSPGVLRERVLRPTGSFELGRHASGLRDGSCAPAGRA